MRQTTTPLPQLIYPRAVHLRRRLKDLVHTSVAADVSVEIGPVHESFVSFDEAKEESYEPINIGDKFSPASVTKDGITEFPWTQRWFKVEVQLPPEAEVNGELCVYFLAHGEFTVYTDSGAIWCGIDPVHDRIPMGSLLNGEERCATIWLDGGQWQTGFWFGLEAPTEELGFRLLKVELQQRNDAANGAYHDLSMLLEYVEYVYEKEGIPLNTENGYYEPLASVPPSLRRLLHQLNQACDVYDRTGLSELGGKLKSIYDLMTTDSQQMKICHVGHAHMDLVWLWPERVTYQKIVHTYSNVLQLMEKYPDFTFTMSQPPLFYHIKDKQPELAERIRDKIRSGRWEFTGALEVEADTQIPVGEGLVRCILYGQERIKAIRGSVSDTVWIPDVFGYSQCLPQLFALAEIPNFFTTKILWSTITKFPHNSFVWTGPDGDSSVLTHLAVSGYNSKVTLKESMRAVRSYQQADVHDEVLCPSGYGDGGGGPSEEQVERSLRLKRSFGGETPSCKWGTADSFFGRLSTVKDDLPVYRGELFLEYHRAVHTTQSDFKFNLRSCERALQTREAMRVISGNLEPLGAESWERYLFALFHDATPGSSIHSVYQELNKELKELAESQVRAAIEEWPQQTKAKRGDRFTIVNPLAWSRYVMFEVPERLVSEGDKSIYYLCLLEPKQVQVIEGKVYGCMKMEGLSAMSISVFPDEYDARTMAKCGNKHMKATPTLLSNGIVDAEFDQYGQVCSLSVHGAPVLLAKDEAASFTLHDDNPEAYDAWDMDHHVVWLKGTAIKDPVTLNVIARGPVASILRSDPIPIGANGSTLVIEYSLFSNEDSLRVSCTVDWKECHKTLRYQVPTDYRGDVARFGAPFNFVDRSQIPQSHKEEGQWEVPASRWASVVNGCMTDGLSIVTEAKYGFRAKMGTLSFTLLRSSTFPDATADQGQHSIHFALSRHSNRFEKRTIVGLDDWMVPTAAKADELFTKPVVWTTNLTPMITTDTFTSVTTLSSIQFAELGSAVPSWVFPCASESHRGKGYCVRLHEVAGCETSVSFSIPVPLGKTAVVETVNLNEKVISTVSERNSEATEDEDGNESDSTLSEERNRRPKTIEDEDGNVTGKELFYEEMSVSAYKIVTLRVSFWDDGSVKSLKRKHPE
ncbi:hypothetical protein ACHAXT_011393 [Thalassiosira profunda]